jgi:murein L,D-transpeptidase YcbB/YkuD
VTRSCYFFIVGALIIILQSCSGADGKNSDETSYFLSDNYSIQDKIKTMLQDEYLDAFGYSSDEKQWLRDFYAKRKFSPLWVNDSCLTKKGIELQKAIDHSLWFGIPENRLTKPEFESKIFVRDEILLTANASFMVHDLDSGFMNLAEKKYDNRSFAPHDKMHKLLKKSITLDSVFLQLGPLDSNYRFFATNLYTYCKSMPLDKTTFKIKTQKEDSLNSFMDTRSALIAKGYLSEKTKDSLEIVEALKVFQAQNGLKADGKVGKYTAIALNESSYNKVLRAALNLEKIRVKVKDPEKFIRINLPEYRLRYYAHDSLKSVHNIVIGKTENQTPELISKIRNIVVFPYWKVPYSISSKEILPDLKRNSGYLAKHNYKLYRNKTEIDPHQVNWKKIKENSFPYTIIQQPGTNNSLGIIKFEFFNDFSVYVHDTPSKGLFGTDVRSYSHGCMRCQNPVDLGKMMLDYDSIGKKRNDLTGDSLDSLLLLKENYVIRLKSQVPIFIEYSTVTSDADRIIFWLDIYKRDEEYLKFLKN